MIRQVKVAKDIAVKARTSAMISLKQVIVNAPPELREELQPLSKMALINRCAGLRPGQVTTIMASSKYTLRAIARRWQQLNDEIGAHEKSWPSSPLRPRPNSRRRSPSGLTPLPRCSLWPVTTPTGFAPNPRSRSSAVSRRSQLHRG